MLLACTDQTVADIATALHLNLRGELGIVPAGMNLFNEVLVPAPAVEHDIVDCSSFRFKNQTEPPAGRLFMRHLHRA